MTRFLMLFLLCPAMLGAQTRYASESLKLRAGASVRARVLTTISAGSAIDVRDCDRADGEWCLVAFENHRGFVEARLLDANARSGAAQPLSGNAYPLTAQRLRSPSSASAPSAENGTSGSVREGSSASRSSARFYRGPRGGCYTYSASGRKRYVDHSHCM
jgi:hypothetical protein